MTISFIKPTLREFDKNKHYLELVNFIKNPISHNSSINNSISNSTGSTTLVPITSHVESDFELIKSLTNWRNEHLYAYVNQVPVTESSTEIWLRNLIANNNKILFLIYSNSISPIGHIGLNLIDGRIEIDNVLRGEKTSPGAISEALFIIEEFLAENFNLVQSWIRVVRSNIRAISWYEARDYEFKELDSNFLIGAKDLYLTKPQDVEEILTAGPSIGLLEKAYSIDAAINGWNAHHSDYINKFENEFAEYLGVKYSLATSSCTGALHLSLLASAIGSGDEVIVPNVTWVATASAVEYVGATPVFADVDPKTWTINPESVKKLITPKTKAIIPVHLYGGIADMFALTNIANEFNLTIIEDAAPAIGAILGNKAAGTFGDIGCFSFQGAKMLVSGEGGMLVTDNQDLYLKAKKFQEHGRKPGTFWIDSIGYKYKISNVAAAIGLAQLSSVERQIEKKRKINGWYREILSDIEKIKFQEELPESRSINWMTSITVQDFDRNTLFSEMKKSGIDTRPVFPVISDYSFWHGHTSENEFSNFISSAGINLPSGVRLNREDINFVAKRIVEIIR